MKKSLLILTLLMGAFITRAQVDTVSIYDIQYVSPATLQACEDSSFYENKIVHFEGIISVDGNLSEVVSGSITGGNRPFLNVVDTANGGQGGPFMGVDMMGVIDGTSDPYPGFENLLAGDRIRATCLVASFDGETQLTPISSTAIQIISSGTAPSPIVVNVGDLNDNQRVNQLETGEQWEGNYVEIQNVTVTAVNFFSGGSRVSLDVTDQNGNVINISDRFLAQKLNSHQTVNPQSPASTGSFVAPPVGTQYNFIRGMIIHSENGCTGNAGRGYELNPTSSADYEIGVAPPNFTNIMRDIAIPTSSDDVVVSADITDFDGSIVSANLKYSTNLTDPLSAFTVVSMTNTSGDSYEATIPANADGTTVRYILEATDDNSNTTVFPFTPQNAPQPNVYAYTVRNNGLTIVDVQKTFGGSDLSSYIGEEVTVTGFVTATAKSNDIGYVYIQQANETEYAGIICLGTPDLIALCRGEEATITGIVEENFGMTRIQATSVARTGNYSLVAPVSIDPSSTTLEMEAYESMLVSAENPGGGKVYINEANMGFGDYGIGTTQGGTDNMRVLAGRQSSSSYSSLYVSLITDSFYINNDGQLEVNPVLTNTNQTMDAMVGLVYYSFSNYRLQPRNNDDIIGFSETLDSAGFICNPAIGPGSVNELGIEESVSIYPNPSNGQITFQSNSNDVYQVDIFDMMGRNVYSRVSLNPIQTLNLSFIESGIYMVAMKTQDEKTIKTQKIIIK